MVPAHSFGRGSQRGVCYGNSPQIVLIVLIVLLVLLSFAFLSVAGICASFFHLSSLFIHHFFSAAYTAIAALMMKPTTTAAAP